MASCNVKGLFANREEVNRLILGTNEEAKTKKVLIVTIESQQRKGFRGGKNEACRLSR